MSFFGENRIELATNFDTKLGKSAYIFASVLSPELETNLLILIALFLVPRIGLRICFKELLHSSPSFKGVFYCRVSSLMADQTDRLASTVINLVLPDKVFVMACQRDWVLYSVSRCVEVKRIDSGLAFPSSRG